jgi:transcriptional regulator with PAS, ATPase and Fis domain
MSLEAQAKLLHVLETRSFRRLGSLAVRRVDVRIIAATGSVLKVEMSILDQQSKGIAIDE